MAVLKAPLFSFGASGKLADSIVFLSWKGLNTVRKYVIPTNPKSPAQLTQRITNFKASVTKWHTFTLSAEDKAAWGLLASTCISKVHASYVGIMSSFNAFMRYFVDAIVKNAAAVWNEISSVSATSPTSTTIAVAVKKGPILDIPKLYYGTTKSYMPTVKTFTEGGVANDYAFALADLTASTKYYFYISATEVNKVARTGIYTQITKA